MKTIAKTTGVYESYDGSPIYYEVRGEGAPVVFVYGIACLINHYHHQIRHFSTSMKTIAYDLRGHHRSQPVLDPRHLTMEAMGKDLTGLIKYLDCGPAHVVGHSFGAPVMLQGYKEDPSVFRSMTFINGFAKNPLKGMFGLDVVEPLFHFVKAAYQKSPAIGDTLWRALVDNPVSMRLAALAGGFNLHLTHFKDIEVYARGVAHMEMPVFLALTEEMLNFNGDAILPTINVPCLVVAGENDKVTPGHFQDELRHNIPNAEFLLVPYGSHCTQLDFPDYLNLRLGEFWERIGQGAST